MPALVRSVGSKASGSSGCTVGAPSGVQPGDLELLFVETLYPNGFSVAGGWTAIVSSGAPVYNSMGGYDSDQSDAPKLVIYRRTAPADCANSIEITGASDHVIAFRVAITGASKSSPVHQVNARANTTSSAFPFFSNMNITVPAGLVFCAIGYGYDSNTTFTATTDGDIGTEGVVLEEQLVFAGGTSTGGGGGLIVTSGQIQEAGYIFHTSYEKWQLVEDDLPTYCPCICSIVAVNEYTNVLSFPAVSAITATGARGGSSGILAFRSVSSVASSFEGEHPHDRLAQFFMATTFGGDVVNDKHILAPLQFDSVAAVSVKGVAVSGNNMLVFAAGFGGSIQKEKNANVVIGSISRCESSASGEGSQPDLYSEPTASDIDYNYGSAHTNTNPEDQDYYYATTIDRPEQFVAGAVRLVFAVFLLRDSQGISFLGGDSPFDTGPLKYSILHQWEHSEHPYGPNRMRFYVFKRVMDSTDDERLFVNMAIGTRGGFFSCGFTLNGGDEANLFDAIGFYNNGLETVSNDRFVPNLAASVPGGLALAFWANYFYPASPDLTLDPDNVLPVFLSSNQVYSGAALMFRVAEAGLMAPGASDPLRIANSPTLQSALCGVSAIFKPVQTIVGHTEAHLSAAATVAVLGKRMAGRDIAIGAVSWISATTEKTYEPIYTAHLTESVSASVQAVKTAEGHALIPLEPFFGFDMSKSGVGAIIHEGKFSLTFTSGPAKPGSAVLPLRATGVVQSFAHRDIPLERNMVLEWKIVASKGASNGVHAVATSYLVASSKELSLMAEPCYTAVKQDPALEIKPSR